MGRKQAVPAAGLEPDRAGGAPLTRAPPAPSMWQLTPIREACFFLEAASPPPPGPAPPPPSLRVPPTPSPPQGFVRGEGGVHLHDSLPPPPPGRRSSPAGTAWVREDLRRLKKWVGDGLALFLLSAAVANWQQATSSRCPGGQRQARSLPAARN